MTVTLSIPQARHLHLLAQGLAYPTQHRATKKRLVQTIAQMRLLQIDTINVVNRSPYLVLFARIGAFPLVWLEEVLANKHIFEVWAHEACFASIEDFAPLHAGLKNKQHWAQKKATQALQTHGKQMRELLAHVDRNGPVKSSDFSRPPKMLETPNTAMSSKQAPGWWSWKAEKIWLEAWFAVGELMIAKREKFQRVYDLTAKVYPPSQTIEYPNQQQIRSQIIANSVHALGATPARWIHDYYRSKPRLRDQDLQPLLDEGVVQAVCVEGYPELWYVHQAHLKALKSIISGNAAAPSHTALLSPFDSVVWDRERASSLFDFDYRIECYTPEAKRQFGYFVMPILQRGQLVGRLDAKAHRAALGACDGIFEVKGLWLQDGVKTSGELVQDLAVAINAFAQWHGCKSTVLSSPKQTARGLLKPLRAALKTLEANC